MYKLLTFFVYISLIIFHLSASAAHLMSDERWQWHDQIFTNYSVKQGLPLGTVSSIAEDNVGFLWVVTTEGLARFDGSSFEHITSKYNGLDIHISSMVSDGNETLWLATNQGLIAFNPNTRQYHPFALIPEQSLSVFTVAIEKYNQETHVWANTENGLFRLNTQNLQVEHYLQKQLKADPSLRIFSIVSAKNNTVWLGTSKGLYYKKSNDNSFSLFDLSEHLLDNQRVSALLQTSDGNIWVATPRSGVLIIDTTMNISKPIIPNFSQEWIYSIAEISPDVVWLGSYGKGIIQLNNKDNSSIRMQHNRLLGSSIANDEIWKIYLSKNGLVWLGTSLGLSLYNPKQTAIKTIFGDTGRLNGISDININALSEDPQGNIWLGLRANGVDIVDPRLGLIEHIEVDPNTPKTSLPGGAIETLTNHPSGKAFIGSNWGIYQYEDKQLKRLDTKNRNTDSYTGSVFLENDYLWAGGTDGLWRFNIDSSALFYEKQLISPSDESIDHRISIISKTPYKETIVGTWSGIIWFDEQGNIVYQLPQTSDENPPFKQSYISSLFYDDLGRLWIATEDSGIYIGNSERHPKTFTNISKEHGLSSNVIRAMQMDDQGRVWISSTAGIDVIDSETYQVSSLLPQEGSSLAPYFRQAVIKTSTGEILFGGSGGLTVIQPENWQVNTPSTPTAFLRFTIGNQVFTNPLLGQKKNTPFIIPAQQNKITIEFSALDFINAESVKYRYRLLGLNNEWSSTDSAQNVATFTMLPPGHYEFELQSSMTTGKWNKKSQLLYLEVKPYWYQNSWFTYLVFVITITIILLFIRYRTARYKKHQLFLEEQVRLRTLTLEQTTRELEKKTQALAQVSVTDPLTGINNRRFLDRNMPSEMALACRRYHNFSEQNALIDDADLIFLLIDIDHFKIINDQYGHQAGDIVLIEITQRLKKIARETDYLVRWGGEEFLIIVRETSRKLAANIADRICRIVNEQPFIIKEGLELSLTCSIGFAPFPFHCHYPNGVSWQDCIDIADKALYTAKNAGRNAWVGVSLKDEKSAKITPIDIPTLSQNILNLDSNKEQELIITTWGKTQSMSPK